MEDMVLEISRLMEILDAEDESTDVSQSTLRILERTLAIGIGEELPETFDVAQFEDFTNAELSDAIAEIISEYSSSSQRYRALIGLVSNIEAHQNLMSREIFI